MRTTTRLALGTALACAALSTAQAQVRAEVVHWWTSGGESAAVKELALAYQAAGGTWVDNAVAGVEAAKATALNRILGGSPPTAAQFNTSKQFHDLIDGGLLNTIDEVAQKNGWDRMLPAPILNSVKIKGHYYAVPINIHMPAWFWYSKPAFEKAGLKEEPQTPEQFFAALDKLKAAGLVPLALGGQAWQEKLTFDAVLAHFGGPELYLKFYRDRDARTVQSDAFKKVLLSFKRLRQYVDAGSAGRNWNDATSMVIAGKAGLQIMGDWAKGEFQAARQVAGKDYGCFPGLGPRAPYIVSGDVFVFPKTSDAATIKAQQLLATSMTAPATQVAFNNRKGSIPIRTDVDAQAMDVCARLGLQIMKDGSRHLPNPEMLVTPDVAGAIQDIVTKYWNTPQSADDAARALAAALQG
ncbi:ABC transporter substrate-binding protein [Eleftheria terrae]|uniref:ABC transporter substrate-binding protein n=1 Tax=Eleftheria terrae TaxID=1597781 RepID=UPI00263BB806|nr:ABC transporter substrate-binding protein [Eleftheria terrae]WKB53168.1 ABC transporter substrate-binding protein [Eleftheria terrae]